MLIMQRGGLSVENANGSLLARSSFNKIDGTGAWCGVASAVTGASGGGGHGNGCLKRACPDWTIAAQPPWGLAVATPTPELGGGRWWCR